MKGYCKLLFVVAVLSLFCGCGNTKEDADKWIEENFTRTSSEELDYASLFSIDYLNDDYSYVTIDGTDHYLVIPEQEEVPQNLPSTITPIELPLNNIYVVGTGSMDYFTACNALDEVKFSSLEANDWELEEIKALVSEGTIKYAGKYSAPDYEMLLNDGCDFIVENTMITHTPEVLTQLEKLGFITLVDHSCYEQTVQGRMEWVKLYGLLTGHMDEARESFNSQLELLESSLTATSEDEKSVAFFSITAAGTVSVRKSEDYICNMIELAGGRYGLFDLDGIEGTGITTIQMEAFYEAALDCDIFIYNGTIDGDIKSISDLVSKNELLANCKAVKDGQVYCTKGSFYQSAMELGTITLDIHKIIAGQDDLDFLVKLNEE